MTSVRQTDRPSLLPMPPPSAPLSVSALGLQALTLAAAGLSTVLAYNVSPSTTFFNQALALAGWGALVWALALQPAGWLAPSGERLRTPVRVRSWVHGFWRLPGLTQEQHQTLTPGLNPAPWSGIAPTLAALALVGVGALLPWGAAAQALSLVAGAAGLCVAAAVVLRAGQVAAAGPLAVPVARAWFGAWAVVGVLHAAVALVQVFAPDLADGNWIAHSSVTGRAVGNLRQPNHLSSLMLWAAIALVGWLELQRQAGLAVQQSAQRAADGLAASSGAGRAFNGLLAHRLLWVLAALGMALFIWAVVLTASRTGLVGVALLALWALADRRLSRPARGLLLATPLLYAAAWWGMAWWAQASDHTFGGQQRLAEGDVSGSRFRIWADALQLIAQHPWTGVGWGNFNFAWSLTPFPQRHTAFFDHTHNLPLQLAVELGLPLALVICALLLWALWQAGRRALAATGAASAAGRCALMMVLLIGLHSLLEYPLWYAYFLLPTAFAWGLALGLPAAAAGAAPSAAPATATPPATAKTTASGAVQPPHTLAPAPAPAAPRPPWLRAAAGVLCVAGALFALFDYLRVAAIFEARSGAAPLEQRIDAGKRSIFFGHHAHYAAATVSDTPAQEMPAFDIATHHLLDTRLMMAWAQAYAQAGDLERARHLAQRLREFRNPASAEFLAECDKARAQGLTASALPFQCTPPARPLTWQDFLAQRPGAQSVAEAR
jgi:O-antigen ligase